LIAAGSSWARLVGLCLWAALGAGSALAQSSPAGLWKTIDDDTHQEKSLVRIFEVAGVFSGKVEKGLGPKPEETTCSKCTDARKDQPIIGMTIIQNARAGSEPGIYEGGEVLDPNQGKTYRLRLKLLEGGKKLEVRGYIGPFYRNQQWLRVE
jgi:uncharacterized protein (DUF2147 family)